MSEDPAHLKCLIIDDEPVAIEILEDYIAKVDFLELAGSFRDAVKGLEFYHVHPADLIFLDINMPDISGIQFLKALTLRPLVIFTTAYSQYALESYDYDAVDYLLKPIEFDRFLKAVHKARQRYRTPMLGTSAPQREGFVVIKSGMDYVRIDLSDILYVQGAGNYVSFVTPRRSILSLMTMNEALRRLPRHSFFRIHRSYIINFNHVDVVEKERVKIRDEFIPIGETYRDLFLKAVADSGGENP
jgi:DNA-binding LytR/AlgR family response regulator